MAKTVTTSLTLDVRENAGTTASKGLRKTGRVPGIVYGHEAKPLMVSADRKAIEDLLGAHQQAHIIDAHIGGAADTIMMRAVQRDPINRRVLHVDFQRISRSETIHASVPVVTVGVAPGVKDGGGMLDVVSHQLDISGPADKMPESLEVDVSKLNVGDHISAKDVVLPAGFTINTLPEMVVVTVEAPRTEVVATPAADAAVPVVGETTGEAK